MIKFFRRIRQKLLSQNKFSKYLVYAIGEILLVVIGILIALQINNWNEQRKLKKLEVKYLKGLVNDVKADINSLETRRVLSTHQKNAALNMAEFLNSNKPINEIAFKQISNHDKNDTLIFLKSINMTGFLTYPKVNTYTIDDIKSSGNTNIIANETIKKAIFDYYSSLENYNDWINQKVFAQNAYHNLESSLIPPDLRNLVRTKQEDQLKLIRSKTLNLDSIIKVLKTTQGLKAAVNGMIYAQDRLLSEGNGRERSAKNILELLQTELKTLND